MSLDNRAAWRNVHFHDASAGTILGGFHQYGSITDETLLWILGSVLLVVEGPLMVKHRESGRTITPSINPVMLGNYDVHSEGTIQLSNEYWFPRLLSHEVSGREDAFRTGVRERDRKCVLSGEENGIPWGVWVEFDAAHVFPLQYESLWMQLNYGRWIKNTDSGGSTINSVQNGLLMTKNIHGLFDQNLVSINPDDGYKVISFVPGGGGSDGRILEPVCRNPENPDRVPDDLLRWHFRQSVLANMRGPGEPIFEADFPQGSDMMATLRTEPYGKERFEMELETRLKSSIQDESEAEVEHILQ